ncbi:uncharacterized protein OCT59_006427 [Rhizophagus irregularis]|uniref:uncharacterized protein n=1 Tax=Rhizophagus irregularis TaxID=588596 RepID=UPI00332BC3E2|nr:hypothetical protein OCT59_006427 [Rhizophagus irregularis]
MTSRTLSTATYVAPFVQTSKVLISKSPSELRNTSFGAALPSTLVLAINHHLVVCFLYDLSFCNFHHFSIVYLEFRRRVTSEPSLENKIPELDNKL